MDLFLDTENESDFEDIQKNDDDDDQNNQSFVNIKNENVSEKTTDQNSQPLFGWNASTSVPQSSSMSIDEGMKVEEPVVHNIVSTANFCCEFDLSKIAVRVRNAEYNPKRFRAVIMRIFEPRTTAMIFASGKIVCTGAKSERLACLACRKYGRIIQKLGYEIRFSEFKIQNIVSTVDIKFPIRLDKLAVVHSQFCTYDPDFFPALIYRMVRPRTVLLIFVSGKIIITGAKSRTEIKETISHMAPVLHSFRKQ